jgi:hypothetical protein
MVVVVGFLTLGIIPEQDLTLIFLSNEVLDKNIYL